VSKAENKESKLKEDDEVSWDSSSSEGDADDVDIPQTTELTTREIRRQ